MSAPLTASSKANATGVAGAAVLVLQYLLGLLGVELPQDVALALLALVMWAAAAVKTERRAPGKHEATE